MGRKPSPRRSVHHGTPAESTRVAVLETLRGQQELLKRQAAELELQATELQQQVEDLSLANAALQLAEAESERAHRRAMLELRERMRQTAHFEAALNTAPIAMSIIDPELRYVRVNAHTAALTGIPIDAHVGRTLRDVNPLVPPELEEAIRRVIATGEPCLNFGLTRPTPHAASGRREIILHVTAFRDEKGDVAGVCCTACDVTEWKTLQEQFFHSRKLEAVGTLAASIAHDFNNLLTIVGSACDILLIDMPDNSPYRAEIEEIRRTADRATTLARRMLGTARSHVLKANPIEIGAVVQEAHQLLEHAVRNKARLTMNCDPVSGVVRADPTQIEQLLMNLVINAKDAMPEGGLITIRTQGVELPMALSTRIGELSPGPYAELTVSDTGTGMDAATLDRIFEPFFTTKGPGKGTGLGLATVFAIARDMNGGIEVTSHPGRGTSFRVLLPRLIAEEAAGAREARSKAATALPRGTETLLVVDDADALRSSLARVFEQHGYRVLQAAHGGEALRTVAGDSQVALVVTDLHMPGVSGRELAERLRGLDRTMPILFMSGSSGVDGADLSLPPLTPGRDRFISKPFESESLLTIVREMLDAQR